MSFEIAALVIIAIVDILRNGVGQRPGIPKHQLRIYQGKAGRKTWKRI